MSNSSPSASPRRCTGAARVSRRRRLGAERQRELRERRRAAGVPEPEALDRAIVDGLRAVLACTPEGLTRPLMPIVVLGHATQTLQARARRAAGPDGSIPYDGKAVAEALRQRLLVPPAPPKADPSVTA